ncbi:hypothetical protein R2083_03995 [Nitrosomonas sp. Is35]|uniref:NACHT domain-containing protein n=1 Tax=Nitrosomonas sp. Is35 TaxID=3080534 RepID=UPI00294ABE2E|nr:hypothetical protein [Nitrosomonas sp. Is35]MDV6346678.1 hypothetical protein [Nitrosomonas sp. Is35]
MNKINESFLVRRTCTRRSDNAQGLRSFPLESFRDQPAYVLLGDPGAGKTASFKREAEESGGKCVSARDFATFEPGVEYQGKTLFIDGLDEMRAGGGDCRTPLDDIRKHLKRLGCPRFRLSCREADWLGASDSEDMKQVSPDGEIIALHLDPLSDKDIAEILRHKLTTSDPAEFMRQARVHRLDELLRNPQVLNLLVEAVGGDEWPQSRMQVYEMACKNLIKEKNHGHRKAKREQTFSEDLLLDTVGYLCAIQLLSGVAGFSLDEERVDDQHPCWTELITSSFPLLVALKTNLFQGGGEELRIPVHRTIAEFLGARYLASRIEKDGLPFGRVLTLITGVDGGVVADLRGLAAWLSVHCLNQSRRQLVERDPLGIILYGDVRHFSLRDKQAVFMALKNEAQRNPWLHSEDWSSSSFGVLGTKEMEPVLREILISSSRDRADQEIVNCALEAIRYGEPLSNLNDLLEAIARDSSYHRSVRTNAIEVWIRNAPDDYAMLLKLAEDIRTGIVEDNDDEILGIVLKEFYPQFIPPDRIFDYLHVPKIESFIGSYRVFWIHYLPERSSKEILSALLDRFIQVKPDIDHVLKLHHQNRMPGNLLVRGLKEFGNTITNEQLYEWLGIGLNEHDGPRLDRESAEFIAAWFADRPERYKAMIELGAARCITHENTITCMYRCENRLYRSRPPSGIETWYLEKAAMEQHHKLAEFYFDQAIGLLKQREEQQELTLPVLEFLEKWIAAHPNFQIQFEQVISCPIGNWQQERALEDRQRRIEQDAQKKGRIKFFRQHIATIRDGSAHPQILDDLALEYKDSSSEVHGITPRERLVNFLDGDEELIEAAYSGFRHALDRHDLPSVSEIVDLEVKSGWSHIRSVCLVGMDELFQNDPISALRLEDAVLSRLIAFQITYGNYNESEWFKALVQQRPALVAEVLLVNALAMLRAGKEHVSGLHSLAHDGAYSEVARVVLPRLLEEFPLRARKFQLPNILVSLLKGALHSLDREVFTVLIARKLELKSMNAAQRVYWLSCGLLLDPDSYEIRLFQHIGKNAVRKGYLVNFLYHDHFERNLPDWVLFSETTLGGLIELLAPVCSPERVVGVYRASFSMNAAELVRSLINKLSNYPTEGAARELERLQNLPELKSWHDHLRHALHTQRIVRRKASFKRLSTKEIDRTLANLQPAQAADLAALTFDHLRDIAQKIRDGSTNDYRQYWSYGADNKKLEKSKPENDCRDALLSDLQERFGKLGINAEREVSCADDKRADIRVSFGGTNGFNIPIEIKKDNHGDLWRAIHEQLIAKYVRDPGTDGYGIYVVFWFGGKGMASSSGGRRKPRSAQELEDCLRQTLSLEEKYRIQVCVIDCALPQR